MQKFNSEKESVPENKTNQPDFRAIAHKIKAWSKELGFTQTAIAKADTSQAHARFKRWLELGHHGDMTYLSERAHYRMRPETLLPGVQTVICAALPYLPEASGSRSVLAQPRLAYISRYALGRDYHRIVRRRLQRLADRITLELSPHATTWDWTYRVVA